MSIKENNATENAFQDIGFTVKFNTIVIGNNYIFLSMGVIIITSQLQAEVDIDYSRIPFEYELVKTN
ncbi:hypothetical protein [Candidatus Nitrosocosmicus sp. T]